MCCGKYWSEMTLHMRVFFMYTHIAVVLLDVTKWRLCFVVFHHIGLCSADIEWSPTLSPPSPPLSLPLSLSALSLLFPCQELQDLGRDPPAQCSAGPVGDDRKNLHTLPLLPSLSLFHLLPLHISLLLHLSQFYTHSLSISCAVFHWQATIMGPISFFALFTSFSFRVKGREYYYCFAPDIDT